MSNVLGCVRTRLCCPARHLLLSEGGGRLRKAGSHLDQRGRQEQVEERFGMAARRSSPPRSRSASSGPSSDYAARLTSTGTPGASTESREVDYTVRLPSGHIIYSGQAQTSTEVLTQLQLLGWRGSLLHGTGELRGALPSMPSPRPVELTLVASKPTKESHPWSAVKKYLFLSLGKHLNDVGDDKEIGDLAHRSLKLAKLIFESCHARARPDLDLLQDMVGALEHSARRLASPARRSVLDALRNVYAVLRYRLQRHAASCAASEQAPRS